MPGMKVRARLKPIDHLPEWYKCCPAMIAKLIETSPNILLVVIGSDFVAGARCPFCGFFKSNVRCLEVSGPTNAHGLAIEAYDLEEGLVEEGMAVPA
jgi:hypothetical protein